MAPRQLSTVVRHEDGTAIIELHGEINGASEAVLQDAYTDATGGTPHAVLLNFDAVDYINSTGIALIIGLLMRARRAGCRVLACGLSEHYVAIFQITRLTKFMDLFPDEHRALAESVAAT